MAVRECDTVPVTINFPVHLRDEVRRRARAGGRCVSGEIRYVVARAYGLIVGGDDGCAPSEGVSDGRD